MIIQLQTSTTIPTVAKPAQPPAAPAPSTPDTQAPPAPSDTWIQTLEKGSTGAGIVGTVLTLPTEIIKTADDIALLATKLATHSGNGGLVGKAVGTVAKGVGKAAAGSAYLSRFSSSVMNMPVIGRLTKPETAEFLTKRVMPTVNAVGSGIAIYNHSKKLEQAEAEGNQTAATLAKIHIGLNAVNGVAGYIPGKAQIVASVAGLTSLGLEITTALTGWGKLAPPQQLKP
jgi:hypothetical protein